MLIIETNVTPPIQLDSREEAGPILRWLQPSLTGDIAGFPIRFAPYGEPQGFGLVVLGAVFLLAVYGAYKLVRRR